MLLLSVVGASGLVATQSQQRPAIPTQAHVRAAPPLLETRQRGSVPLQNPCSCSSPCVSAACLRVQAPEPKGQIAVSCAVPCPSHDCAAAAVTTTTTALLQH